MKKLILLGIAMVLASGVWADDVQPPPPLDSTPPPLPSDLSGSFTPTTTFTTTGSAVVAQGRIQISSPPIQKNGDGEPVSSSKQLQVGEAVCYEAENYINGLVDYTQTKCLPAGGKSGALDFLVISSQPIFSVQASKKAWLICVVGAFGKVLNDRPNLKVGELDMSDLNHVKNKIYFMLPASLVKSLQKKALNNEFSNLEKMYAIIQKNLVKKTISEK